MKRGLVVLALVSMAHPVWSFIPPISEILSDVFDGRKFSDAIELDMRHQVQIKAGEFVEVSERFVGNRKGGIISWQIPGQPIVHSDWTGKQYVFRNGKKIPSRTAAFIDYFLVLNGNEYLDRLLREGFVRREQLLQFKPGYLPAGDPKTWPTKESYLLHNDIFFQKEGSKFGIKVIGTNQSDQKRSVVFSKNSQGILRLEWQVGAENAAWQFSAFSGMPRQGRVPKVFSLNIQSQERVRSTLASMKTVSKDALATVRLSSHQASVSNPPTPLLEEAIRLIVRYR